MDKLTNAIVELALDTENPEKNYNLAMIYESMGQTASAINYFFRAAERTTNKDLAYECLLKKALCWERQGNRTHTVMRVLQHAVYLRPKRPEGYFLLSRILEKRTQYTDAYTFASIGLQVCDFDCDPLRSDVEYPGKYGLIHQKAVCAWWWGKNQEARDLFVYLGNNHYHEMTESYKHSIQDNVGRLGCTRSSQAHCTYDGSRHNRLKYKFHDSYTVRNNFSQVYQDMFTLYMLDGKRNGFYLEVGAGDSFHGNNSALFEKQFGWKGVSIEFKQELVDKFRTERTNPIICQDALTVDYSKLLNEHTTSKVVDYLQLDCEPSSSTYEILTMIPFDEFKFAVITYEHDHYVDFSKTYREKSRNYLRSKGYELVVNDISPDGVTTFEDWWVHPELVGRHLIDKIKTDMANITNIEKHFISDNQLHLNNLHVVNNIDWSTLTMNDITTIQREIGVEDVYGFWREVQQGDVVVDIGASVGPFICTTIQNNPAKIYCVEPSKILNQALKSNIDKFNPKSIPVSYIEKAIVGDYDAVHIFGGSDEFETTSFMDFIKDNDIQKINYLKMDCEGGEYSIFSDESIDYMLNNVEYIAMETHLSWAGCREKFIQFRDKYLVRFKNYKVISCTTQNISNGNTVDLKKYIFDDKFIETYNCEFMIYIWN